MRLGGLGARAALKQKPTKPCQRCGLNYPVDEPTCPHCTGIKTDLELAAFKESIEAQRKERANLGKIFFIIALVLGMLLLLF